MRKAFPLLLALLLVLSLTACSSSNGSNIKEPSQVAVGETKASENVSNAETTESTTVLPSTAVTIEEVVLLDEDGVKITAKSLNMDAIFGPEVKLLIENNSGKNLTVQSRNTSVNGYMVESMLSVDIADGKKANDELIFLKSDLDACGISDIADMEFAFNIFTTADWEDYLNTEQIQLKTSIADTYEYTFDDRGNIVYDSDGIKIIIKGLSEDSSIFGPGIMVYMENNTGKAFTVQSRDVSINGFMIESMFSCDIMPGKKAINAISFFNTDLEENGITAIENAELRFNVFDSESWDDIVNTDIVSIDF